jgi:PhnB protein
MNTRKISINPYLSFDGKCREAMLFYETVFAGKLDMMSFEGSPILVPDDQKDRVMHATLSFGDAVLMASDGMPGMPVNMGSNMHVSVSATSVEEAQRIFMALSKDGIVVMPFELTFWGEMFGMLIDQFGIPWMIGARE